MFTQTQPEQNQVQRYQYIEELKAKIKVDGFAVLKGVFSEQELATVRTAVVGYLDEQPYYHGNGLIASDLHNSLPESLLLYKPELFHLVRTAPDEHVQRGFELSPSIWGPISTQVKELIQSMLTRDPMLRISAEAS